MSEPRNHVHFSIELPAEPGAVFSFFTESFDQIWPGKQDEVRPASEGAEPKGLGYIRSVNPPGVGELQEEITVHERPKLIEYKVINDGATIYNHLGRITFTPSGSGTRVDYTIDYDYKPAAMGVVSRGVMNVTWKTATTRRLRSEFPGT